MSALKNLREWSSIEKLPEGFTAWLKEIVAERETKQRKGFRSIAEELGVNPSFLSRWIAGFGPLNEEDIRALVTSLGSVVYTFLDLTRPNTPHHY